MNQYKKTISILLFFISLNNYAQLGFCAGSKGEPIFIENFGNGTDYGPALPVGTTNYTYIAGSPNDGFYTLFSRTNLYNSWHNSADHTPDATNGPDGKCLVVNANASTSGDFYKRTVSGLCVNTTFEFSSWLINVYNPTSDVCVTNEIPINVRFEIWNASETIMLRSGNTGNIYGSATPIWQQFALVFTTVNETTVVLKMKNNGIGGCGNDLAIDDIEFKSCGDLTTISSPLSGGSALSFCENSGPITLQAATAGTSTYFYQWQTSTNGVLWTDIPGANTAIYITPNLTSQTYYRTKMAQDATNLNNNFCSTLSSVFSLLMLQKPTATVTTVSSSVCFDNSATLDFSGTPNAIITFSENNGANQNITLNPSGTATFNTSNLTQNTTIKLINAALSGTSNCDQSLSSFIDITVNPKPIASFNGSLNYCSGETLNINLLSNILGTTFSWTVTQNGTTGAANGSGSTINQVLTANNTMIGSATYFVTPFFNGCTGNIIEIMVNIKSMANPNISDGKICLNFSSPSASQFYTLITGLNATDYSFNWFLDNVIIPSANSNSYTATQLGMYSVIATDIQSGCVSSPSFATVKESIQGSSLVINQSEMFSDKPTITINVIGGDGPFLYKLDDTVFQNSNVFYNISSGTHLVSVVDETYCTNLSAMVTVINAPTFFTPNGDGFNDFWNVAGFSNKSEILIFDRFGKLIKQIYTNGPGWDGTQNGQALLSDDYWFTIFYTEKGIQKQFNSHFTLKR